MLTSLIPTSVVPWPSRLAAAEPTWPHGGPAFDDGFALSTAEPMPGSLGDSASPDVSVLPTTPQPMQLRAADNSAQAATAVPLVDADAPPPVRLGTVHDGDPSLTVPPEIVPLPMPADTAPTGRLVVDGDGLAELPPTDRAAVLALDISGDGPPVPPRRGQDVAASHLPVSAQRGDGRLPQVSCFPMQAAPANLLTAPPPSTHPLSNRQPIAVSVQGLQPQFGPSASGATIIPIATAQPTGTLTPEGPALGNQDGGLVAWADPGRDEMETKPFAAVVPRQEASHLALVRDVGDPLSIPSVSDSADQKGNGSPPPAGLSIPEITARQAPVVDPLDMRAAPYEPFLSQNPAATPSSSGLSKGNPTIIPPVLNMTSVVSEGGSPSNLQPAAVPVSTVGAIVQVLAGQGGRASISVDLAPAEFGRLRIQVDSGFAGSAVRLSAERPEVIPYLQEAVERWLTDVSAQGFRVQDVMLDLMRPDAARDNILARDDGSTPRFVPGDPGPSDQDRGHQPRSAPTSSEPDATPRNDPRSPSAAANLPSRLSLLL
jgi:hypothetical protein